MATTGNDFVVPEDKGVPVPVPEAEKIEKGNPTGRRDVGKHVKKHRPVKRLKAAFRKAKKSRHSLTLREFAETHEDGKAWFQNKTNQ